MRATWRSACLLLAVAPVAAVLLAPRAPAQNVPLSALPFLEISPSPALNAVGGAGVGAVEPDPHGFLYNPAALGLVAREARALSAVYPGGATDWLAVGDLSFGSTALGAGFGARPAGLPLAIGVGLAETALRFGERVVVDAEGAPLGAYEPTDRYYALALGAATTGAARVGVGATVRHVRSTDRVVLGEDGVETANVWGFTFDLGLLAEADVTRLLGEPPLGRLRPALSVAAGYAQTNIGGEVAYTGSPKAPLPRTARLGWSARAGLDLPTAVGPLRLAEATLSIQAEHSLVRHGEAPGQYRYAALLGDLDPLSNGLLGDGTDTVTGRRGWRIAVGETVVYSRGGFDGWGFRDVEAYGFEVRAAGPLKAVALLSGDRRLADWSRRFDLRFTRSVVFSGETNESVFSGLTLVVRR
ncbi:MAG: hypothetical protein R3181_15200 [Rubricoccaceae bacterium]|nr:hypothetical protein [Rubricoccaceae bacterium]